MVTARIRTLGESMARSTTQARSFKIFMDETPALGGEDGAPSPLEYLLAAHGGSLSYMTFYIGKELGIDVKKTDIEIDATLDPAKLAGANRAVRAGCQAINVTIQVDAHASRERLERLREEVEERCPLSDNLANPTLVSIALRATEEATRQAA